MAHLRTSKVGFHSYALEDERQLRVDLKSIPIEIETETIFCGVESQDLLIKVVPGQCHHCQLYVHSAKYCHAKPRFVKCLDDYTTIDCPRKATDPAVPPSCVLCETQGHPTIYRGCSIRLEALGFEAFPSSAKSVRHILLPT